MEQATDMPMIHELPLLHKMIVYVRPLTGKLVELETHPQQTIQELKIKYQVKVGMPPDQSVFIKSGHEVVILQNHQTIEETKVQNYEII